jgi:hypothetical protein
MLEVLEGYGNWVTGVTLIHDCKILASDSNDRIVIIWLADGRLCL